MELLNNLDPGFGHVDAILGPMFSEKTNRMLSLMRRYKILHTVTVLLFRAATARQDDKGKVLTHAGHGVEPDGVVDSGDSLILDLCRRFPTREQFPPFMVLGLEEAQFVKGLDVLVDWVNCHVGHAQACGSRIFLYFTALDGTFQQQPWPEISAVLPKCRHFEKSTLAICMCCRRQPAPYSRRDTAETELVLPGAQNKYSASCRRCLTHAGQPTCCCLVSGGSGYAH